MYTHLTVLGSIFSLFSFRGWHIWESHRNVNEIYSTSWVHVARFVAVFFNIANKLCWLQRQPSRVLWDASWLFFRLEKEKKASPFTLVRKVNEFQRTQKDGEKMWSAKKNVQAERKSSRIKINVDAPFARCSMISESHLLAQAHIEAMQKCDEKNKIGISTQLRRAWETIEPIFKAILMSSTSSRGARKQPEQNTTFCAIRHKTALFPRFCFTFFLRYLLQLFSFFSLVSLFLRW